MEHVASPPFDTVFSIEGDFDPPTASQLRVQLDELSDDTRVVLDFSHASEVSDLALALVASAAPRHARVVLRGLTQHQERMLRYLGVDR